MIIWDAIDPVELTGFVRGAQADLQLNQFTLSRWLPNRAVPDLNYRFLSGGQGLIEAATFRTWDTESPIGARAGVTRVSGELPPISRKIRLGEYEQLRLRNLTPAIEQGVFDDAVRMMRSIAARLEMARGEALYTGKVTLNENGVLATVDFGRAAGHTVTPLAGGALWSATTTATPLTNLIDWVATYVATNGAQPAVALISTTALGYLLRNTEIRDLLRTGPSTVTRVSRGDLTGLLADHGLPTLEVYDAQVTISGTATRVIPADKVVLLPPPDANPDTNELGATMYGTTAAAAEVNLVGSDEAGIVALAYKEQVAPFAVWTEAVATALPVVANPNLTLSVDVY